MPRYLPLPTPLFALTGRFVVEPLVRTPGWQADGRDRWPVAGAQARIARPGARLEPVGRTLDRVVEEREVQRAPYAPATPGAGAVPSLVARA